MSFRVPRTLGATLVAVLFLLSLCAVPLAAQGGADCPDNSTVVAVTFDAGAGTVGVDKASVEIVLPGGGQGATTVCWRVSGLESGQTLHIGGKDGDDSYFPSLERSVTPPRTLARSGVPAKAGTWTYGLSVTNSEGATLATLDPEIIIKG